MNKRAIGSFYEDVACRYLEEQGLRIIERNYYCKAGELDLIGREGEYTVFFEVKYRKSDDFGGALLAVNRKKQRKICQSAMIYCLQHREVKQIRYDVIAITQTEVQWIKNAFDHLGYCIF